MLVEACRGKEFVKMWTVNGYIVWWPLAWLGDCQVWLRFGEIWKKNCRKSWICLKWCFTLKTIVNHRLNLFSPKCRLCSQAYLLKPTVRPWKSMVGRWKFPLGCPIFRGYVSSGSVNGSSKLLHFFVWLHKMHKVLKNGRVQEWRWNIYDGKCGGFKCVLLFSSLFTKTMKPFWQSIVLHQLGWEFPNF